MNSLEGASNAKSRADPRGASSRLYHWSNIIEAGSHAPDIHRNRDRHTIVGRRRRGSPRRPRRGRRVAGHSDAGSERTDRPTIGAGERRAVRAETESTIDVARAEVGPSSRARVCAVRPGESPRTDRTGAVVISVPIRGLRRWQTRERGVTGPSRGDTLEPLDSRVPRFGASLGLVPATVPLDV